MRITVLLLALELTSCSRQTVVDDPRIKQLEDRISALEASPSPTIPAVDFSPDISNLKSQFGNLVQHSFSQYVELSDRVSLLESSRRTAPLGVGQKGYRVVQTRLGFFFVTVRNVEPYLDGFRIKLGIGNPQAVLYSGLKLAISYPALRTRPSMDPSAPAETMSDKDKWEVFDTVFTDKFYPAQWTSVTVEIPKITLEQLQSAACSVDASQIVLK